MLVEVKWQPENDTNRAWVGPLLRRIASCLPRRAGRFRRVLEAKLKELEKIPSTRNSRVWTAGDKAWRIGRSLGNIRGTHVYGQIARPVKGEKFPLLIVQWAGVYGLQKSWVTDRAADGWLALDIEPHDCRLTSRRPFTRNSSPGR